VLETSLFFLIMLQQNLIKTCRICLEGPHGISNPLRLRCSCTDGGFHDICFVKWILHYIHNRYQQQTTPVNDFENILPTCEICRTSFRGVVLKIYLITIRPGIYIASSIGIIGTILSLLFSYFFVIPYIYLECDAPSKYSYGNGVEEAYYNRCPYLGAMVIFLSRSLFILLAYVWGKACYMRQLQKFPENWIIPMRVRRLILKPSVFNQLNARIKLIKELYTIVQQTIIHSHALRDHRTRTGTEIRTEIRTGPEPGTQGQIRSQ
jgi:hypothetical protein